MQRARIVTAAARAFYRSDSTRWAFIITGVIVAFTLSPVGPDAWRDTPSLDVIHRVTGTWWIVTALFICYSALLLTNRLRLLIVAECIGLWLYACGLVALLVTIRPDHPTNPLVVCGLVLACVLHYQAARLALIQYRVDERGHVE